MARETDGNKWYGKITSIAGGFLAKAGNIIASAGYITAGSYITAVGYLKSQEWLNLTNSASSTEPSQPSTGEISIYSIDTAADEKATLGIVTELDEVVIGTFTASHKIKIKLNGTEYYIQLDAV